MFPLSLGADRTRPLESKHKENFMRNNICERLLPTAVLLSACLGAIACGTNRSSEGSVNASTKTQTQAKAQQDLDQQRQTAQQQVQPEVENQRRQMEEEGKKSLDQDAIVVINDTQKAIDDIAAGKADDAMKVIEEATGKVNILLARNPATAFIPVSVAVDIIDAAPHDTKLIRQVASDASAAMGAKDYPSARVLLYSLTSEIRSRTFNLPLATYPDALKEAARLLDQKKNQEASSALLTALNTLVVVDKVTPLPLVLSREALRAAKEDSQKDKATAQILVQTAKNELQRSKELGYAAHDPEYEALDTDIASLEKQLKGNQDATAVFAKLEDKLSSFLKRQSGQQRR
jgi:hypothetical protein